MFALPTPFFAKREVTTIAPDGKRSTSWEPCRVIGVTKDDYGEPAYLVEVTYRGETHLAVETFLRKNE